MTAISQRVNLISLFVFHGANTVMAAIAFPWALTVLGDQSYSAIVFSEAIALLFIPLVIYGFDLIVVRNILSHSDQRSREVAILEAFPAVTVARILLFCIAASASLVMITVLRPEYIYFSLAWLILLLGWAVQPTWYFQATQNHLPIAISTLVSRIAFGVFGYFSIPTTMNPLLFPLLYGGAIASGSILAFAYVAYKLKSRFWISTRTSIITITKEGFVIFISNFSVSTYRGLGVIFLELFQAAPSMVALYSICEKITKAIQAGSRPLNQYFLPRIIEFSINSKSLGREFLLKLLHFCTPQLLFLLLLWVLLTSTWLFGDIPKRLNLSDQHQVNLAGYGLIIMAAATIFGLFNFVFGATALNAIGGERKFFFSIIATGIITTASLSILIPWLGAMGAFIAFFMGEFILFILVSVNLAVFNRDTRVR